MKLRGPKHLLPENLTFLRDVCMLFFNVKDPRDGVIIPPVKQTAGCQTNECPPGLCLTKVTPLLTLLYNQLLVNIQKQLSSQTTTWAETKLSLKYLCERGSWLHH